MAEKIEVSEEQIKLIEKLAGQGLNVAQMSAILGFSKDTFERRCKDTPGLAAALEKGRAEAANAVTQTAYRLAVGGRHPAMTMFWLKCRERWKETSAVEHSGPDGKPIETKNLSDLTDGQLEARRQLLLDRLGQGKEEG